MESAKETADKISNVTASLEIQDVEIKDGKKTTKIFSVVLKLRDAVMKVLNWLKSKFTIKEEIIEGWGDDKNRRSFMMDLEYSQDQIRELAKKMQGYSSYIKQLCEAGEELHNICKTI